eukprot:TRINITY_DN1744_c0_g2_i1.p4 TRINITY_DN1744_c0_g2~~TRINITY_DN1744_c0_g2_i1.p4  ORF type:complete len:138 (+),score=24.00 TRINITY_DN1744_c0_g2_i1:1648-2061(+)
MFAIRDLIAFACGALAAALAVYFVVQHRRRHADKRLERFDALRKKLLKAMAHLGCKVQDDTIKSYFTIDGLGRVFSTDELMAYIVDCFPRLFKAELQSRQQAEVEVKAAPPQQTPTIAESDPGKPIDVRESIGMSKR